MTMSQMIKKMNSWDTAPVPAAGEVVIELETNKIKIGDGKTNFANLPYIDGSPSHLEYKLSDKVKQFIENNITYIKSKDYDMFYSQITNPSFAREVTEALLLAGMNPRPYLSYCPKGCESLFHYDDKDDDIDNKLYTYRNDDWSIDYSRMYTKSEIDAKLHEVTEEFTKRLYKAIGIPAHLMTIKVEGN